MSTDTKTILDRLAQHAQQGPDRLAYRFLKDRGEPECLTYGELDTRVGALAEQLREQAAPGDRGCCSTLPGSSSSRRSWVVSPLASSPCRLTLRGRTARPTGSSPSSATAPPGCCSRPGRLPLPSAPACSAPTVPGVVSAPTPASPLRPGDGGGTRARPRSPSCSTPPVRPAVPAAWSSPTGTSCTMRRRSRPASATRPRASWSAGCRRSTTWG